MSERKSLLRLPPSCTNLKLNFFGVFCFFLAVFVLREVFPNTSQIVRAFTCFFALCLPIVLYEVFVMRVYKNPSARLSADRPPDYERVAIKLLGLVGTFAVIAFFYWIFPEYSKPFFNRYWDILFVSVPFVLLFSWYYFLEVDLRMENPKDGYWHMGCLMIGKFREVDLNYLAEHYRAWTVKAFFLPLMFIFVLNNINNIIGWNFSNMNHFLDFYRFCDLFIYTIDVCFAAVGYVMTFRLLDSHIRSVEPTMLGWVVAIVCYPPFWSGLFYGSYFAYNDGYYWGDLTGNTPILQMIWGSAIIFSIFVYSTATVCLGYRFSNLTYRGLVTNGPYRFTKHPAYLSKNISWWLISIPFISAAGVAAAIKLSALLLGVNLIYYLRARTEENHLSNYPEYVEYAKWMEEHGLFRFVGQLIPYFKYDEKRAKSWNSEVWWKKSGREEL